MKTIRSKMNKSALFLFVLLFVFQPCSVLIVEHHADHTSGVIFSNSAYCAAPADNAGQKAPELKKQIPESHNASEAMNTINSVAVVVIGLWLALAFFLFRLELKIKKLEKMIKE